MPKPINVKVKSLYDALKADGADVGTEQEFNEYFTKSGDEGYQNRKAVWQAFKDDGADVGTSYEEFRDWLGIKPPTQQTALAASTSQSAQNPQGAQADTVQPTGNVVDQAKAVAQALVPDGSHTTQETNQLGETYGKKASVSVGTTLTGNEYDALAKEAAGVWKQAYDKAKGGENPQGAIQDAVMQHLVGKTGDSEMAKSILDRVNTAYVQQFGQEDAQRLVASLPDDLTPDELQNMWIQPQTQIGLTNSAAQMSINKKDYINMGVKPALKAALQDRYGVNFDEAVDTMLPMRDYSAVGNLQDVSVTIDNQNFDLDFATREQNRKRYEELMGGKGVQLGFGDRFAVDEMGEYNPETGKYEPVYYSSDGVKFDNHFDAGLYQKSLDAYNDAYRDAINKGEIPDAFGIEDWQGNYALYEDIKEGKDGAHETAEGFARRLDRKIDYAQQRLDAINKAIEKEDKKNGNPLLSYNATVGGDNGASEGRIQLGIAKSEIEDEIRDLETVRDRDSRSNIVMGLENTVGRARQWDFGITDFALMSQMERIRNKINNGQQLTLEEAELAKSNLGKANAAALENKYMWQVYRAVKIGGESLPYMLDFILTGGFGGVTKWAARQALKFAAKRSLNKVVAGLIKNTGVVAGDIFGATSLSLTEQAFKTGADIMQRHLGKLYLDDNGDYRFGTFDDWGNLMHEGGNDFWTAVRKGVCSAMVENYTEKVFGHNYGIKRAIANGLEGIGASGLVSLGRNLSQALAPTKKALEKAGINGLFEEIMEEEINIPLNAMLVGDNKLTDLLDEDQQGDIVYGMLFSIGSSYAVGLALQNAGRVANAAVRLPAQAYNTAQYYRMKHRVDKWDALLTADLGEEKWAPIRDRIDATDNDNIVKLAHEIWNDESLSTKERNQISGYIGRLMLMRGYNFGSFAAVQANSEGRDVSDNDVQSGIASQAYSEGYEVTGTPEERYRAKQAYDAALDAVTDVAGPEMMADLNGDPIYVLHAINSDERWSPEQKQVVVDYVNAKARYDGMIARVQDDIDTRVAESDATVDNYTHQDSGMVVRAAMREHDDHGNNKACHIVSGEVVMNADGVGIDTVNSSASVIIRDEASGEIQMLSPSDLVSVEDAIPAEQVKQEVADAIRQTMATQAAAEIDGGNLSQPSQGAQTAQNPQGTAAEQPTQGAATSGFDANALEPGMTLPVGNGELAEVTDVGSVDTGNAGMVQLEIQNPPEGKRRVDWYTTDEVAAMYSVPVEGNGAVETVPEAQSAPEAPAVAEHPEPAANNDTALSRIPVNDKGKPQFTAVDAATAWDGLLEKTKGDAGVAQGYAQTMVEATEEALKKAQKVKTKATTDIDKYVAAEDARKAAIAAAQAEHDAWKAIAGEQTRRETEQQAAEQAAAEERRLKEEAERKAAKEKADAERKAQEEAERKEREAVKGVPEWKDDNPSDARARGFRRSEGHKYDRQDPIANKVEGNETETRFAAGDAGIQKGRVTVIEATELQPSHTASGQRNVYHFISEAQPKERTDAASQLEAENIAKNNRPEEIVGTQTAYTGAPTTNSRGEVIQGNNRSIALKRMYDEFPESAARYKQYLIDHADEFGLDAEAISKMERPVLVNMAVVSDGHAIELGQYTATDTESGGDERIKPEATMQKLGTNGMQSFARILLSSDDAEATISQLIDTNGIKALKWLNQRGIISNTQIQTAIKNGTLTGEGRNDLQKILQQGVFQGGGDNISRMFAALPAKAQRAILQTAFRDFDSPEGERMLPEIQASIQAYYELQQDAAFMGATNYEAARKAVMQWSKQYQLDMAGENGESFLPSEKYSNFALTLAALYKGATQTTVSKAFNDMYDFIQGKSSGDMALFEEEDTKPHTLVEAAKKVLGINYEPKDNDNGEEGSNAVAEHSATGQAGQQGSPGDTGSGESGTQGDGNAQRGGGAAPVRDEGGAAGAAASGDAGRSSQDNQGKSQGQRYTLSTEKAGNGEPFYQDENGNIDLVTVDKAVFDKIGYQQAPFRLTPSMIEHMLGSHAKELGFSTVDEAVDFVMDVMHNFDHVRLGYDGALIFSVENGRNRTGKRAITILINSDSGKFYGLKTSGYEAIKGLEKRPLLWERGAKVSSSTDAASASVPTSKSSVSGEQSGSASNQSNASSSEETTPTNSSDRHLAEHQDGVPDLLPTQANGSSEGKVNQSSANSQENGEKKSSDKWYGTPEEMPRYEAMSRSQQRTLLQDAAEAYRKAYYAATDGNDFFGGRQNEMTYEDFVNAYREEHGDFGIKHDGPFLPALYEHLTKKLNAAVDARRAERKESQKPQAKYGKYQSQYDAIIGALEAKKAIPDINGIKKQIREVNRRIDALNNGAAIAIKDDKMLRKHEEAMKDAVDKLNMLQDVLQYVEDKIAATPDVNAPATLGEMSEAAQQLQQDTPTEVDPIFDFEHMKTKKQAIRAYIRAEELIREKLGLPTDIDRFDRRGMYVPTKGYRLNEAIGAAREHYKKIQETEKPEPATEKQTNYITKLIGTDDILLKQSAGLVYNKLQASVLIDELKRLNDIDLRTTPAEIEDNYDRCKAVFDAVRKSMGLEPLAEESSNTPAASTEQPAQTGGMSGEMKNAKRIAENYNRKVLHSKLTQEEYAKQEGFALGQHVMVDNAGEQTEGIIVGVYRSGDPMLNSPDGYTVGGVNTSWSDLKPMKARTYQEEAQWKTEQNLIDYYKKQAEKKAEQTKPQQFDGTLKPGTTQLGDHGTLVIGGIPTPSAKEDGKKAEEPKTEAPKTETPKQESKEEKPKNPSGNMLVSDERYEELRKRMLAKLRGQLNVGIDPEILAIGTEMAVYHIERGARKFAEYAKSMIEGMGDVIRPYLKAFYNGARDLPEMEELSKEMTPYDEVRTFDTANFGKEKPATSMMDKVVAASNEEKVRKESEKVKKDIDEKVKDNRKTLQLANGTITVRPATAEDLENAPTLYHNGKATHIMMLHHVQEKVGEKSYVSSVMLTDGTTVKGEDISKELFIEDEMSFEEAVNNFYNGNLINQDALEEFVKDADKSIVFDIITFNAPEAFDSTPRKAKDALVKALTNISDKKLDELLSEKGNTQALQALLEAEKKKRGGKKSQSKNEKSEKKDVSSQPQQLNLFNDVPSTKENGAEHKTETVNGVQTGETKPVTKPATQLAGDSAEKQEQATEEHKFVKFIADTILARIQNSEGVYEPLTMRDFKKVLPLYPSLASISDTDLQELVERAMTTLTRKATQEDIAKNGEMTKAGYDAVVRLYEIQPSLNARDSTRVELQQYSTPTPFGWLMGQFIQSGNDVNSVLEPSAGNGALTIAFDPKTVHVNDIDERRLANLRTLGFGTVTAQNGLLPFEGEQVDAMLTNPPFGSTTTKTYDEVYRIGSLEGQMAINGLDAMKDDGRAAIIIGGNTEYRSNGVMMPKDMSFFGYLYNNYNVVDVINLDGAMYARNGTKYPVRMILIDGRRTVKGTRVYPPVKAKGRAEQVHTFDELYKRVQDDILRIQERAVQTGSGHGAAAATNGRTGRKDSKGSNSDHAVSGSRPVRTSPVVGSAQSGNVPSTSNGRGGNGERGIQGSSSAVDNDHGRAAGGTEVVSVHRPDGRSGRERESVRPVRGGSVGAERGDVSAQPNSDGTRLTVTLTDEKVPYPNRSQSMTLMSVVPAAQADVLQQSLAEIGDVDQFLVDELGYSSKEELFSHLAAEQIDSVALAIKQMGKGDAFIIGDMTGVGKGRQGAALIRYAIRQGKKPVYFTQKSTLFSDNYRDLCDIGCTNLRPFILASQTKDHDEDITDAQGNLVHKLPSQKEIRRVLEYITQHGTLPEEYDYLITTYSQIQNGTMDYEAKGDDIKPTPRKTKKESKGGIASAEAGQRRRDALAQLVKGNYMILDESHTVGGNGGGAHFMQYCMKDVGGCTFLSATFAKRADNMPLYAMRTDINKSGISPSEMIEAIQKGGVTLQEIMSKQLVQSGQMIRRERNFKGVNIDWLNVEEAADKKQRAQFDEVANIFEAIRSFQDEFIAPLVGARSEELAEVASYAGIKQGTKAMGVDNVPFASKMYNLVNQLLFALKADAVADRAIWNLEHGFKPVISFTNTMEGFLEEAPQGVEMNEVPNFSLTLMRALDGVMRYSETDAFGNKTSHEFSVNNLSPEGASRYNEIRKQIMDLSADLPISPVDAIKMKLQDAGYTVGELTGRKIELTKNKNGKYVVQNRTDRNKKASARDFNEGKLDVLMLNKSASTGISLHSSTKFGDQRQRVMIFAQFQSDINDEVQMRGRIDRTGQVSRGKYEYIMSSIPAEQRLQMMFKAKLKSLDANTTSSQKSKFNEMEVVDFLNKYGDEVVASYMQEHPELKERLGDPLAKKNKKEEDDDKEGGAAAKVCRYLPFLPVKEQEEIFKDITEAYTVKMQLLNDAGENDLEITTMPLRAETKSKKVWTKGTDPGSGNSFADNTYLEEVEVDVLKKPMKADEVRKLADRMTGGKTFKEWRDEKSAAIEKARDEKIAALEKKTMDSAREKAEKAKEKYIKETVELRDKGKNTFTDVEIESLAQTAYNAVIEQAEKKLAENKAAIVKRYDSVNNALHKFDQLEMLAIPMNISESDYSTSFIPSFGTFVGFKLNKDFSPSSSTAVFATLDGRRKVELPLKEADRLQTIKTNTMMQPTVRSITMDNWDERVPTSSRKTAYIVTGNLMKALVDTQKDAKTRGFLISYSTIDGETRQGILLKDSFKEEDLRSSAPISSKLEQIMRGDKVVSEDGKVSIEHEFVFRRGIHYKIKVPKSKQSGGKYFLDRTLCGLITGGNFVTKGNFMVGYVTTDNLPKALNRLSKLGATVSVEANLKDAKSNKVRKQKVDDAQSLTSAERALRDVVSDIARKAGIEVIEDEAEGQRVLDLANDVQLSRGRNKKSATETALPGAEAPFKGTVVSSADGAKILKKVDTLIKNWEVSANYPKRTVISEIARAFELEKPATSSSQYGTFILDNGDAITFRVSDHSAKQENFDGAGHDNAISIVIARQKQKAQGVVGGGNAHVVEFVYMDAQLKKSGLHPLADIVKSMKEALSTGEYVDTTGLAKRYEVPSEAHFFKTANGEAYGFTVDGKIYIDPRIATAETPVHEYAHLWGEALRHGNPKEWQNVVNLMKGTSVWEEVKKRYPELETDDEIADEVLAHYSGRRGAERLRAEQQRIMQGGGTISEKAAALSAIERVRQALKRFWKATADFLHIHYKSADEVADRVMKDLLDGVNPIQSATENNGEFLHKNPNIRFSLRDGVTYFSGGGLVEAGLAGAITPKAAVELERKAVGVYRNNFGDHIVMADVQSVDPKELVKDIDGGVGYFHASPVCKNFSKAKTDGEETPLDMATARSTAHFIKEVQPKVVTIENVKGYRNSSALKTITDTLTKNGYKWDAHVYNAADYGAYTNRERLIVRAVRDGELPPVPKPTGRPNGGWLDTVSDIIDTLPEKKNGIAPWMDERLKASGIDYRNIKQPLYVFGQGNPDGKVPHAFGDQLLPTLRTKSGDVIIMPDGRVLKATGRVLARISGLPDSYDVDNISESTAHSVIGNGVPTQLTKGVIAPLVEDMLAKSETKNNILFRMSDDLTDEYGTRWLDEQTTDDGRHTTQVKNTINSYKKFGEWVKRDAGGRDVSVLDASSGLGLGTQWMRENGIKADDVEPYPSENREKPTFGSYAEINKKYDYIISNAVLNVIPDDWRANVLHDMAGKMKVGGKMVINVRGAQSIREQGIEGKTKITLDDPSEILVLRPDGSIRAYQKGFTKPELKEWVERELGDGYTVEVANTKNAGGSYDTAVVVTKNNESSTQSRTAYRRNGQPTPNQIDSSEASRRQETTADGGSAAMQSAAIAPSGAKVVNKPEATKLLIDLSAKISNGKLGTHELLHEVAKALSSNEQEGKSTDKSEYFDLGGGVTLRVSDHQGNARTFADKGEYTNNYGVVIKVSPRNARFKKKDGVDYLEYVYYPDKLTDSERQKAIVDGLASFLNTGDYSSLPEPDRVNTSGKFRDAELQREGEAQRDASIEDDPYLKMGVNRFSPKQRAAYNERQRRLVHTEGRKVVEAMANAMHLNNVEVLEDGSQFKQGDARRTAKGFFNPATGKITIMLGNHTKWQDVAKTLLHEAVAHYGLRQLVGEENFNTFLDNVYKVAEERIKDDIDKIGERLRLKDIARMAKKKGGGMKAHAEAVMEAEKKRDQYRHTATEEYMAKLAEDTDFENAETQPWLKHWFNQVKHWFSRMFKHLGMSDFMERAGFDDFFYDTITDNELRYILWRSYKNLTEPGRYRLPLREAKDIVMQQKLKVGNFSEEGRVENEELGGVAAEKLARPSANRTVATPIPSSNEFYDETKDDGRVGAISASNQGQAARTSSVSGRKGTTNVSDVQAEDDVLFRDGDPEEHQRGMARASYEHMVSTGWYQVQEAMQDSMLGLEKGMKAIMQSLGEWSKGMLIEDVPTFENPYLGENALSSVNQDEAEQYNKRYMRPLLDEVKALAKNADQRAELTDYMMAKHGHERNDVMARRAAEKQANEEFKDELRDAQRAVDNDPLDPVALANLDDVKQRMHDREEELYFDNRENDYAGLTALTETDNVVDAEAEAARMVYEYEAAHDTQPLWDAVNAATKATLEKTYKSGMMSKETYLDIAGMYQNYIPLRGFDEKTAEDAYAYLNHRDSVVNAPIKTARGRKSKADDPLANIASMAETAIMQGNRNTMVKQRALNFALNHPSDLISVSDLWLHYDKTSDEWVPVFPDNIEDTDTPDEVEQKMKDFEEKMRGLREQYPDEYKSGHDTVGIPYRVVNQRDKQQHQVIVKRNGRDYVLTVNGNPRMAQALNGQTNPDNDLSGSVGKIISAAESVNRGLASVYTTRNPNFVASNFIRDQLYGNAMVWVKESPAYAARFNANAIICNPVTMKWLLAKDRNGMLDTQNSTLQRYYNEFMRNGGETGFTSLRDIEAHKKEILKELKRGGLRAKWKALGIRLDELNRAVENAARFAAYVTSRQMGRDVGRSVWDAKEISVNFNKKGAGSKFMGATGQTAAGNTAAFTSGLGRSLYVFWNAAVQGSFGNFFKMIKRHPLKSALGAVAAPFVLGLLVGMIGYGGDDDDEKNKYANLPKTTRRQNICFKIGDQYITIPLPTEVRAIYGMGELAASVMLSPDPIEGIDIAKEITEQFSQILPIDFMEGGGGFHAFVPSSVKPIVEVAANESWTGIPIYNDSEYQKYLPEWRKAYKTANAQIVGATKWLNEATGGDDATKGAVDINPAQIEYLLNGYFSGYWRFGDQLVKSAETAFGDRDFDWRDVPLANRVVKTADERNAYKNLNTVFYRYMEDADKMQTQEREYKNIVEDQTASDEKHAEYLKKHTDLVKSKDYERMKVFQDISNTVSEMNKAYKQAGNADFEKVMYDLKSLGVDLQRGDVSVKELRDGTSKKAQAISQKLKRLNVNAEE